MAFLYDLNSYAINASTDRLESQNKKLENNIKGSVDSMESKRTDQLNIRITPELTKILTEEAEKLSWSKTKLAEKILNDWARNRDKNGGAINFIIHNNQNINIERK